MTRPTYVVAGNGNSLAQANTGRIQASDHIVRTNNFFFEQQSYLGTRIDLAVMGGDPRVAPFMFETLWQCRTTYDLKAWTSHNPVVIKAGLRRFGAQYTPLRYGDPKINDQVQSLIRHYGRKPMTGTYAVLAAYGAGAGRILLTGMDFYQTGNRYAYQAGRHQSNLLGIDLNQRGLDTLQHNPRLDLAIFALLQEQDDVELLRTANGSLLDTIMDLAPKRTGPVPIVQPTHPPTDWAPRAGLYPIAALKLLRWLRRATKHS